MITICVVLFASITAREPIKNECKHFTNMARIAEYSTACKEIDNEAQYQCSFSKIKKDVYYLNVHMVFDESTTADWE